MTILVTGVAGFIGYHVAEALMARGDDVIGIDNLNDYYDVALK
ncbi:MAG: NAD-dependent epimerase/dehydratase family protein, partial [Alphaproteobacteria bacterium]